MGHRLFVLLFTSTLLVACGGDKAGAASGATGDNGLPKPGAVSGSVTGMPNPGTASAPPPLAREPDMVELPGEADAGDLAAGDDALQPMVDGAQPAVVFDQPEPGVPIDLPPADAAPVDAAGATDPSPPQQ